MDSNIKVFRAHRALSWLYALLAALCMFLLLQGVASSVIYFMLAGASVLFFAHYFTAKGARERKPWARVSSIIIALVMLLAFPLGTLIGVYLLANTWRNWEEPAPVAASDP